MGLAWGKGKQVIKSPIYGSGWEFFNLNTLTTLHLDIITKLKTLPYGPYDALVKLIGVNAASSLAMAGECTPRNISQLPSKIPSSKRKPDDSDSDMEISVGYSSRSWQY
jgi:hypothetical protein